jgi:hypothetical protein
LTKTTTLLGVAPEKGSNPRMFRISNALMERLKSLPKTNAFVFGGIKLKSLQKTFPGAEEEDCVEA